MQFIKKATFSCISLVFAINACVPASYSMEEGLSGQKMQNKVSPLKIIAADAYINSLNNDINEKTVDCIRGSFKKHEETVQGNDAVLGLVKQRLGKNAHTIEYEFDMTYVIDNECIVNTIPELGQVITFNAWKNKFSVWHRAPQIFNALVSMASMPCFANALSIKERLLHEKWKKIQSFKATSFSTIGLANFHKFWPSICAKEKLIFLIKRENFKVYDLVFYSFKNGIWQHDSTISMENPIMLCAYSEQNNLAACTSEDNNTITILQQDEETNAWGENSVIALAQDERVANIKFLPQKYDENPLLITYTETHGNYSYVIWQKKQDPQEKKYGVKWQRIETIAAPLDRSILFLPSANNERYIIREFDGIIHRFSPDCSRYILKEHNRIEIYSHIDGLLKTIPLDNFAMIYNYQAFFIDNDTIALLLDYYDEYGWTDQSNIIISLHCSTDFSLCNSVLEKAHNDQRINVNKLPITQTFEKLQPSEKKQIIDGIAKVAYQRSLQAKMHVLRKKCRLWAFNNPRKAYLIKTSVGAIPAALLATTATLHYAYGPPFIDWNLPRTHRVITTASFFITHTTLPLSIGFALHTLFGWLGL